MGFVSSDVADLFRPLNAKHALKDPFNLKPPWRVKKCALKVLNVAPKLRSLDNFNIVTWQDTSEYNPIGVLTIKIRLADEEISVTDLVNGPYMKWAVVQSLAEAIPAVSGVAISDPTEDIMFCMEQVNILDVQMPFNGKQVWQFCDFRFDYMLNVGPNFAGQAVEGVFHQMAVFERVFCKALETKFRDMYHLTVLNLVDKQYALMDGHKLASGLRLFEAASSNNVGAVRDLLKAVDVNWKPKECAFPVSLLEEELRAIFVGLGRPALLGAAEEGHVEAMRALLDAKADVNIQDNAGFHALYLGAGAEDAEKVVKFLLAWGANVHLKNKSGYTALHNACGCGEVGAIKALLEAKADLNAKSSTGSAPVHVAVLNNEPASLEALAALKANLDMPAFGGNTPIHEAVMQNSPAIIKKLVELKANPNVETGPEHGFATPLKMAIDRKKKKAAKMLESLGALQTIEGHEYEDDSEDGEAKKDADGNVVRRVTGRRRV